MVALINNNYDKQLLSTSRPKLVMIWEKAADGGHQRLVARWVIAGEKY